MGIIGPGVHVDPCSFACPGQRIHPAQKCGFCQKSDTIRTEWCDGRQHVMADLFKIELAA